MSSSSLVTKSAKLLKRRVNSVRIDLDRSMRAANWVIVGSDSLTVVFVALWVDS